MKRTPPDPTTIAAALGAGAAAALVMGLTLGWIATPRDFTLRTSALERDAARAEALLRPLRDRGPFGAEALCSRAPAEQARLLQQEIGAQAASAGLTVESLETRVEPSPEISERVAPVRLRFAATGSYEGAVGLAALLSRARPQVFVDSFDLVPKVSNVTISMSGRVFCGV